MNSKQAGRSQDPTATANAIMHADIAYSLYCDLKRDALRVPTDYTSHPRENHVLLADHKILVHHSSGAVKRRLAVMDATSILKRKFRDATREIVRTTARNSRVYKRFLLTINPKIHQIFILEGNNLYV